MNSHLAQRTSPPRSFKRLVAVLGCAAAAVVAVGWPVITVSWWEIVLWVVFTSAANLLNLPILPRLSMEANLGSPVLVAAAVLLDPTAAFLVGLLAVVSDREFRRGTSPWMIAFNRLQEAPAVGGAALAVSAFLGSPATVGWLLVATALAAVAYNVINAVAIALGLWLMGRVTFAGAARDAAVPYPRFAVDFGLVLLLALLIVIAYQEVGPWSVLLLAMPLWLGYSALRSARESADRAEELALRVRELETLNDLGERLLAVRSPGQVASATESALRRALDADAVTMALDGDIDPALDSVAVPGGEAAAIGVPPDLSERSSAVVEATAGLAGMVLQRTALERELAENEKALARLAERILEEGNHERSRIALELHDAVLPYFAAAQIQVDNVRTALEVGAHTRADELAGATHDAVADGIARLRDVLDAIRDQILVPGGLRGGLQAALADLDLKHGVDGRLEAEEPLPPMPLAVEILVLETVRGCLTNVARHADASRVEVDVAVRGGMLRARVEDDGVGFDPEDVGSGHHGLVLMAQRVELARGRLRVDSTPGKGTRVDLEVPV